MSTRINSLAGLILAAAAAVVVGQDRPTSKPDGTVASPYWDQARPSAPAVVDSPAAEIRAVPAARAQAVHARWSWYQAQTDLYNALRLKVTEFNATPEYRAALKEQADAWDGYIKARDKAVDGLKNDPAYRANEAIRKNLTEQIADAHDTPKPDPATISAMSTVKLNFASENRKLEMSVLDRDSDYKAAQQRYREASAKVKELDDRRANLIATDPALSAMRQAIAEAHIDSLTTAAYLDSALVARDLAIGYANTRDSIRYHYNYPGVYDYGYSSPYSYTYGR